MAVCVAVGGVAVLGALSYNRFVRQRNLVRDSWATIDTELRRRHDLIPNLVETVSGYATHERSALEAVVTARRVASSVTTDVEARSRTETVVSTGLVQVLALVERYPDLRASTHFLALQRELVSTEDRIQAARRVYNANVRGYNTRLEAIPTNVVGRLGRFERAPYFELEAAARSPESTAVA
jgi:LemA protein